MESKISALILAILLLLVPAGAAGQGLTWETRTSINMAGYDTIVTKTQYRPRLFKQGSENQAVVFKLDERMMYSIDYGAKEYAEITFEQLEKHLRKASDQLRTQIAELQAQLDSLPPDQRKMAEERMGGEMPTADTGAFEVRMTDEMKTISGFSCRKYSLTREGVETASVWTTHAVEGFEVMQADFREFAERMAAQMLFNGTQMAVAMRTIEGFPVETTIGKVHSLVTKAEPGMVEASEFTVPAGFTKVPFRERVGMEAEEEEGEEGDGRQ